MYPSTPSAKPKGLKLKCLLQTLCLLLFVSNISRALPQHGGNEVPPPPPPPKPHHETLITDEAQGRAFLEAVNLNASAACNHRALKDWAYSTNLTAFNKAQAAEAQVAYSKFWKEMSKKLHTFDWKSFTDPEVRRQFKMLSVMGIAALPEDKLRKFNSLKQSMVSTYSTATVCDFKNKTKCDLNLVPEVSERFRHSRDPEELHFLWSNWRNQSGRKIRKEFTEMAHLFNEAAKLNKFKDATDFELRSYESETFRQDMETLWNKLQPLYFQLHAYVRNKLRNFYGPKVMPPNRTLIPAHLLGDMWSQSWVNLMDIVRPYNKTSIDVTPKMVQQGMTATDMAKIAEDFFVSLKFEPLPELFWQNSVLEKPKNHNKIVCHASAWDFCDGKDFRIKQCTRIEMEDLIVLHHEMGHTQYQMQYKDQPKTFREGANPGFHEAIGDLIALSVQTPMHLHQIGLLGAVDDDQEGNINYLLSMALEKIAFLPFAYLMDSWRWSVFKGETKPDRFNCEWWKLRVKYQGIVPPDTRDERDFDPGSKFHIAANSPYIQYFVSTVLQFQLHRALCETAGKFDPNDSQGPPLHKCDIYKSEEAGEKLKRMLQMGSSKPWPEALELVTGTRALDAGPILDYFDPLFQWLRAENNRTGEIVGWETTMEMDASVCKEAKGFSSSAYRHFTITMYLTTLILVLSFL